MRCDAKCVEILQTCLAFRLPTSISLLFSSTSSSLPTLEGTITIIIIITIIVTIIIILVAHLLHLLLALLVLLRRHHLLAITLLGHLLIVNLENI